MVDHEVDADHARPVVDVREVAREHDGLSFSRFEGKLSSVERGNFSLEVREHEAVGPGDRVEAQGARLDDAVLGECGLPL